MQVQASSRKMIRDDRAEWKRGLIQEAKLAELKGDHRAQWTLVKRLSPAPKKPLKAIVDAGGQVINDPVKTELRWQEHFSKLLKAEIVDNAEDTMTVPNSEAFKCEPFEPDVGSIHHQIRRLK